MASRLTELIRSSPSPALARTQLERLTAAAGAASLKKLPTACLPALFTTLGGSQLLGDILIREERNWPALFLEQINITRKSTAEHHRALAFLLEPGVTREAFAHGLRRYKQREVLRIGVRDLAALQSVEETMRELTVLAEAALEATYRFARREAEHDFGKLGRSGSDAANRFVILGMGKLGGGELNFSSDIDLIYLYESDEGESSGGARGTATPRDFFTAVAERVTQLMGEVTEDGFVFRTDLRLRPLGRGGPIVQSLPSALLYYESWGQCWERAALIKARPVAGDRSLGREFLREVEPFIYRRYLDFATVEDLRDMKRRIERELLSPAEQERNVKLGRGGIREVEFFTQALQLVNGGYDTAIRSPATLEALAGLAASGYIAKREQQSLSRAYRFLRDVEHKLQMVQEAQTHLIPKEAEAEQALARRLGCRSRKPGGERERFWRAYSLHTASVRSAFNRLFYGAQAEIAATEGGGLEIWKDLDREERILESFAALGFKDPQRSYRHLLAIRDGAPFSPPSPRRMKVMQRLGPALMGEIIKSNAPEQALFKLAEFSHRVGSRTGFLSLLAENPKTLRLLISLFASSQFLTDLFLMRPELIDSLIRVDLTRPRKTKPEMARELFAALAESDDLADQLNRLRRFRSEEVLRVGTNDLGGALNLTEILEELSELASACLEGALRLALEDAERSYGRLAEGRFTILGMGKLGGREIDYNSDLDLIFIYDAPETAQSLGGKSGPLDPHQYYVRVGQRFLTFLAAPMEEGVVYKIDMRLRPSGNAGPLVSSLEAFRRYHQTSSELWERQALTKARAVAGDPSLGRQAQAVANRFAYARGLEAEEIAAIHHLRMRMERELAQESDAQFNLKKGRGGMVDIEFITQMLQLSHGHRYAGVRQTNTLNALKALRRTKLLSQSDYQKLSEGYLFLRRLDHRLRLERDQSLDILEREAEKIQSVASALGYSRRGRQGSGTKDRQKAASRLLRDYERWRETIRSCYERFFRAGGQKRSAPRQPERYREQP